MTEWAHKTPADDPVLEGTSLRSNAAAQQAAESVRSRLDIREGYRGLEIAATSYVGRLDIGPLRIVIQPKLKAAPLTTLVRYAYGLRNLSTIDETRTPTIHHGMHDLLIAMLADEVEELLSRGLARRYIPVSEKLESPRGRILVTEVARQGGITEARLPCLHFDRNVNWHLYQILCAGLGVTAEMTEDRELQRRIHRLLGMFDGVDRMRRLDIAEIDRAEHALTRLTIANAPALTIIRLLRSMHGAAFEQLGGQIRTPGFLFDMNSFFQRLLSRFLRENLTVRRIADERPIRSVFAYSSDANPRGQSAPSPRPDYALFRASTLEGFLDAKYRDIWERGLPPEWLYQLSVYALASPSQTSVLLYATMSARARDERIEVRQPVTWSSGEPASVILRPVLLPKIAELVRPDGGETLASKRQRYAGELVSLTIGNTAQIPQAGAARAA
jgi:5-methylcytosine-specific restriction enzyme subunit McrC